MKTATKTFVKLLVPFLVLSGLIVACGGSGDESKPITVNPLEIQGAWQLESMSVDGSTTLYPLKADPKKPFEKLDGYGANQLLITDKQISLLSPEGGHYLEIKSNYKIEQNKIETIDTESSEMTDLVVHGVSKDKMSLEFDDGIADDVRVVHNYKRISTNQVYSKTAPIVDFAQTVDSTVKIDGTDIHMASQTLVGQDDLSVAGEGKNLIDCDYNTKKATLSVSYAKVDVTIEDGSYEMDIQKPNLTNQFPDLALDELGDGDHKQRTEKARVTFRTENVDVFADDMACDMELSLKGLELNLSAECLGKSKSGQKIENLFVARCLIRVQ